MKPEHDLQFLLDEITVHDPDNRGAAWTGGNKNWPEGWWAVSSGRNGIVAYFAFEADAFRFRLDWINRLLNPTPPL